MNQQDPGIAVQVNSVAKYASDVLLVVLTTPGMVVGFLSECSIIGYQVGRDAVGALSRWINRE